MYSSSITAAKEDAQAQFGGDDTVNIEDLIKDNLVPDVRSILEEARISNDHLTELVNVFSTLGFLP